MKKYLYSLIALFALGYAGYALANPSLNSSGAALATATSSPVFMTPGTATSTVVYDAYEVNGTNQTNGSNTNLADSATFLLQLTASSTNTIVNVNFEYADSSSVDCKAQQNNCDWYQDGISIGATSTVTNLSLANTFQWKYASTTPGLGAHVASNNRGGRVIQVKTPTRYVRAIITLNLAGTNGAVWGKFVPKKEVK